MKLTKHIITTMCLALTLASADAFAGKTRSCDIKLYIDNQEIELSQDDAVGTAKRANKARERAKWAARDCAAKFADEPYRQGCDRSRHRIAHAYIWLKNGTLEEVTKSLVPQTGPVTEVGREYELKLVTSGSKGCPGTYKWDVFIN